MATSNSAAWLDAAGGDLRVGPAESYKPGKGEVLVEIHAAAINPADEAMWSTGMLIQKYPFVLGCDAAGIVVEVGEGVTNVSVGSRVLALTTGTEIQESRGSYQKYAVSTDIDTTLIPDEMSFVDASVIPLCYSTAAAGLYMKEQLALPLPSLNPKKSGKTLLVWGGAACVGCMAIQLAVASGFEVITTCSPRNFELCKSLGAKEAFDYKSETVVKDITAALQGSECAGVYEASGMDDAMKFSAEILSAVGGGHMATARWPKDLPSNVTALFIENTKFKINEPDRARLVWQDFLSAALKSGQFKSAPKAEVAGHGLEQVQDALKVFAKGVSAKKIVIDSIN